MPGKLKLSTLTALAIFLLPLTLLAEEISEGWNTITSSATSGATARLLDETGQYIDVEWNWSQFKVTTVSSTEGRFHKLSLGVDLPVSRQTLGEPELPIDVTMINYPSGTYGRVEILASEWVAFENVRPYPVQYPARDDATPPFAFDDNAYKSGKSIPAEIAGVTTPKGWGGLEVGSLWASPFRYIPSEKRLEVAKRIKVRVWFEHDGAFRAVVNNSPSPYLIKAQQNLLLNPPVNPPEVDDFDEPEPVRLLVVYRHEEALAIAQPLIDLHENRGLRSDFWMLEGEEETDEIRDYIRDLYTEGLQYVLFIGDGDRATPDIPMRWFDDAYPGPNLGESACGSDSWYTCMDAVDRDGYVDHLPDIALGRLVYDNINALNQLQAQVDKLTDYVGWRFEDQSFDWLRRGLLVAHEQWDDRHDYIPCKRTIAEAEYDFQHPEWIFYRGDQDTATNARLIQEINGTGVGIFNYRGHGSETNMADWNGPEDINGAFVGRLNNRQRPFILISSACLTGDIYVHRGTCLMEAFQKFPNGAALCSNGCTMSTITLGNSYADIAIFKALYDDGIFNIGYANNQATTESVLYFDANADNGWRGIGYINMRAYLWLGDATVEYRLADPAALAIAVSPIVPVGTREIEVTVSAGGEPFEGAVVVAKTPDDEVFTISMTNGDGIALMNFDEPLAIEQSLMITASHREAIPVSSPVIVANGLGVVSGRVLRRSDNEPLTEATVDLTRFHLVDITGQDGSYRLEGIPSGQYEITASVPGMIRETVNVNVVENIETQQDFELIRSGMEFQIDTVVAFIVPDTTVEQRISYSNTGDGTLNWSVEFRPDVRREPYELITEVYPGLDNGDNRIYGTEFIGEKFYAAGGNSGGDPNYIYVYNRDGDELRNERFEQASSGNGFRDLAWDGQYLYGSANREIKVMTLDGDLVETIVGPYDPNRALAIDPDGSIWVGNNRSAIVKINREGLVLTSIPVNVFVMGLAWYPEQAEGYKLLVWGRLGVEGVNLYGANPETGRMVLLQDLASFVGEAEIEGLSVTNTYDARDWILIGMVGDIEAQTAKLWQLDARRSWIEIDPATGELAPERESEITLRLNSDEFPLGTTLTGAALFTTNNVEEVISLPISVNVSPNAVDPEHEKFAPSTFTLTRVYPNPFNANLKVEFALPGTGILSVGLYDLQGRLVASEKSTVVQGQQTIIFDAASLSNGLYIVRAEFAGKTVAAKAALLK